MVQGYDRREQVQNPNAQKTRAQDPNLVPIAPVMSPRPSSFSKVGSEASALGDVLANAVGPLAKYREKQKEKAELDGQMMYYQGKAEQEARAKGEHSWEGWVLAKTKTYTDQQFLTAQKDIENGDFRLTPDEYRKKMSSWHEGLMNEAGDNQIASDVTKAFAVEYFPRLMESHYKAHNEFNTQENVNSFANSYVSTAQVVDPKDPSATVKAVHGQMDVAKASMPFKQFERSVDTAYKIARETGNASAMAAIETYMPDFQTVANAGLPDALDKAVQDYESGGKDYGADGKILRGPLITNKNSEHYGDRAWGRYQVMSKTLDKPGYGVAPAKDRSVDEINRVGKELLAAHMRYFQHPILAAMAHQAGRGGVNSILAKGDPRTNEITWEKFFDNAASLTDGNASNKKYAEEVMSRMEKFSPEVLSTQKGGMENLMKAGFSPETVLSMLRTRSEFQKEQDRAGNIAYAVQTDSVNTLTGKDLDDALKVAQGEIAKRAAAQPEGTNRELYARTEYLKFLTRNDVVDKELKDEFTRNLSQQNIMSDDKEVQKRTFDTYSTLVELRKHAPKGYIKKYLGDDADMIYNALAIDGGRSATPEALRGAAELKAKKDAGGLIPKSVAGFQKDFKTMLKAEFDELEYSKMDRLTSVTDEQTTWATQMTDAELSAARNNPDFAHAVEQQAILLHQAGQLPAAAVKQAFDQIAAKTEFVLGNAVMASGDSTILDDMGIPGWKSPNTVHEAMVEYLSQAGPLYWKGAWKLTHAAEGGVAKRTWDNFTEGLGVLTNLGDTGTKGYANTISSYIRGVPNDRVQIKYNTDTKQFIVAVYNAEGDQMIGNQMAIDAVDLGRLAKQQLVRRDLAKRNDAAAALGKTWGMDKLTDAIAPAVTITPKGLPFK